MVLQTLHNENKAGTSVPVSKPPLDGAADRENLYSTVELHLFATLWDFSVLST